MHFREGPIPFGSQNASRLYMLSFSSYLQSTSRPRYRRTVSEFHGTRPKLKASDYDSFSPSCHARVEFLLPAGAYVTPFSSLRAGTLLTWLSQPFMV